MFYTSRRWALYASDSEHVVYAVRYISTSTRLGGVTRLSFSAITLIAEMSLLRDPLSFCVVSP